MAKVYQGVEIYSESARGGGNICRGELVWRVGGRARGEGGRQPSGMGGKGKYSETGWGNIAERTAATPPCGGR